MWSAVRASCVMLLLHCVLRLRLEQQVFQRLPPYMITSLLETCMKQRVRPRVLRIVALQLDERVKEDLLHYTGKDCYDFGDLTKATIFKYTGKKNYRFGDIAQATVSKFTKKDGYEFGDISRTILAKLDGKEIYRFGDITSRALKQQQKDTLKSSSSKYQREIEQELKTVKELRTKK
jgi:hypothetical protein